MKWTRATRCAEHAPPTSQCSLTTRLLAYSTLLQETMAYHLRELVNRHIQDKHLGTAYASASETAR